MIQVASPIPSERVHAALERVLARGEFRREKSLLEEFLEWLLPRLGSERIAALGKILPWLLAFALLGLCLALLLRMVRSAGAARAAREGELPPAPISLDERLRELRRRSRSARASGDLRLALRLLFLSLLLALGGRGDLVYRDAWTNRELLRRGKPSRSARALLEPLVRELEAKDFGRDPVCEADLDRLESLLQRSLAREEAA